MTEYEQTLRALRDSIEQKRLSGLAQPIDVKQREAITAALDELARLRAALAEEQAVVAALRESLTDLHHMTNRGNLAHRKRDSMDYASGVIRQARAAARGEK